MSRIFAISCADKCPLLATGKQSSAPIPLMLDVSNNSSNPHNQSVNSYQSVIKKPEFWDRLYAFLKIEFENRDDASLAIEEFLVASKGHLSAHEIAKIRDIVGLFSMGGI